MCAFLLYAIISLLNNHCKFHLYSWWFMTSFIGNFNHSVILCPSSIRLVLKVVKSLLVCLLFDAFMLWPFFTIFLPFLHVIFRSFYLCNIMVHYGAIAKPLPAFALLLSCNFPILFLILACLKCQALDFLLAYLISHVLELLNMISGQWKLRVLVWHQGLP